MLIRTIIQIYFSEDNIWTYEGPNKKKVKEKCITRNFGTMYFASKYKDERGCSVQSSYEKCIKGLRWNEEGKVIFGIPRYRWKEILKLVLNKKVGWVQTGFIWFWIGASGTSFARQNWLHHKDREGQIDWFARRLLTTKKDTPHGVNFL